MNTKKLSHASKLCLSLCFLNLACHWYSLEKEPDGNWRLNQFGVQPAWTEKDKEVPFVIASVSQNLPESYHLENLPPAGNQGAQASGTAWAIGYFAASYVHSQNNQNKEEYQCSPAFIYNSLNNGVDRGIELAEGLELLKSAAVQEKNLCPIAQ